DATGVTLPGKRNSTNSTSVEADMKKTACERRIASLQASANTYKTPYMRNRALGAIAKTQECCHLCELLVERTVKASEAIERRINEKSAKLAAADQATRAKFDKLKQEI